MHIRIAQAEVEGVRRETIGEDEFLVVNTVALREGVFRAATASDYELYLAAEFGRVPGAWNGRPVTLGHPQVDGGFVSAGAPEVWRKDVVGTVFGAAMDDGKLKVELWVDLAKSSRIGGAAEQLVDDLESGVQRDVSIGTFVDAEQKVGEKDGRRYTRVLRNFVPDHIAILAPDEAGACSWEDGCGTPRMNAAAACCDECAGREGKDDAVPSQKIEMRARAVALRQLSVGMSDKARRDALDAAIRVAGIDGMIVAVYDESFVYFDFGVDEWNVPAFERGYTIADDGKVTLAAESVEVRFEERFVPVAVEIEGRDDGGEEPDERTMQQEEEMTDEQQRAAINEAVAAAVKDALAGLVPAQPAPSDPAPADNPAAASAVSPEEWLERADMPAEVKAALASGLRANAEHRQGLIRTIKACKRNTFADEELGAMTDRALERLADLAGPAGQGATLRRVDPLTGQPARYHLAAPSLPSGGDEPKEPYRPPLMFSRAKEG